MSDRWKFVFSSHFDGRFVSTGKERNWSSPDSSGFGGRGLTRYGGVDPDRDGAFDTTAQSFRLSKLAFVFDVQKKSDFKFRTQLEFIDDENQTDSIGRIGLSEIFIARKFRFSKSRNLTARMGALFPNFSLEHTGLAWTAERTLTPSAINSWFAEEVRPVGLELNYSNILGHHRYEIELMGFSMNDPMGSLLHYRGWAFHDRVTVFGQRNRFNQVNAAPRDPTSLGDPFLEIDGRLSGFAGLKYSFKGLYELSFYYLDTNANNETRTGLKIDYAWDTKFSLLNIKLRPVHSFEILAQYIDGSTSMKSATTPNGIDGDFDSWYVLASYNWEKSLVSLRYEEIHYKDSGTSLADDFNQKGNAFTLAYFYRWDRQSLGLEYVSPETEREGNDGGGTDDPSDELLQVSYRFNY